MTNQQDNDTLYISLNEIVENYNNKYIIPEDVIEWYIKTLNLLEEGDTVITGSYNEWILLFGKIINKFFDNEGR